MLKVVLDTNVLVSALLSLKGAPAQILAMAMSGQATVCYDSRILLEYKNVLLRDKFPFESRDVLTLLDNIFQTGMAIIPKASDVVFLDEADKKFYEVAKEVGAYLITGNMKHFPDDPYIVTPANFLIIAQDY